MCSLSFVCVFVQLGGLGMICLILRHWGSRRQKTKDGFTDRKLLQWAVAS